MKSKIFSSARHGVKSASEIYQTSFTISPGRSWFQRIDGREAVSIAIYQESGANIVEVCERVVAAFQEI